MTTISGILGKQDPSQLITPPIMDTKFAKHCLNFLEYVGFSFLPWQELVLNHWLSTSNGGWSAPEWGLSVSRQNGKNYLLEARELVGLCILGETIIHSAHHSKTALAAFKRLSKYFEDPRYPELMGQVKMISRSTGRESIELNSGAVIHFLPRTRNSARGFTVDLLIFDEAQEFSEDALSALLPTNAAGPLKNPQAIYTGTPPADSANSIVFNNMRNSALDLTTEFKSGWIEWSASQDDDANDISTWAKGNPSLGLLMTPKSLETALGTMNIQEFYRERLGAWIRYYDDAVIPLDKWEACINPNFIDDEKVPVSISVDISPNRDSAAIVACGVTMDNLLWIDVVEHRAGNVDWVVPKLAHIVEKQQVKAIFVDGGSSTSTVIAPLKKLHIKCTIMGTSEVTTACALFYDRVVTEELCHTHQASLNNAVVAARKRPIRDAWGWSRQGSMGDITPLVAASYALYGQLTDNYEFIARGQGSYFW